MTHDAPFTTASGSKKILPTMRQGGSFRYLENAQFQAVALPYRGSQMARYVLLPAPDSSLAKLVESLSAARWEEWTRQFTESKGSLELPHFKVDSCMQLARTLIEFGMERAFDGKHAEFGGIQDEAPLWLDQVLHRAVAEVNEEGTEAAAATMMVFAGSSLRKQRPEPYFRMIVDRPFVFLVRDEVSGAILFLGFVIDPS